MEFIYQQFPTEGYPVAVFFIVTLVGIALILLRPFWAFLFSVSCLAGKNLYSAVWTRMDLTGEFLNLNDVLLWIALIAMLIDVIRKSGKILLPKVIIALILVLLIGAFQSFVKYGTAVFVFRSIWAVAIFPILFIVASNMVRTETQARLFFGALFAGAILAAIQHMIFLGSAYAGGATEGSQLRTIAYISSGGYFIIAAAFFSKFEEKSIVGGLILYTGLVLIAISALMNQTRQLYIIFMFVIVVMFFLLQKHINIRKGLVKIIAIVAFSLIIASIIFINLDFTGIIGQRFEFLQDKEVFESSYMSRWMGFNTEINLWLDTTMLFGTGTAYPPELIELSRPGATVGPWLVTGALDHVAISSYLAHYGLAGAMLYLVFLPLLTLRAAYAIIQNHIKSGYLAKVALLAMAVSLMDMFNLFGSMLNSASTTSHIPALIYGALWGISMNENNKHKIGSYATSRESVV